MRKRSIGGNWKGCSTTRPKATGRVPISDFRGQVPTQGLCGRCLIRYLYVPAPIRDSLVQCQTFEASTVLLINISTLTNGLIQIYRRSNREMKFLRIKDSKWRDDTKKWWRVQISGSTWTMKAGTWFRSSQSFPKRNIKNKRNSGNSKSAKKNKKSKWHLVSTNLLPW